MASFVPGLINSASCMHSFTLHTESYAGVRISEVQDFKRYGESEPFGDQTPFPVATNQRQ